MLEFLGLFDSSYYKKYFDIIHKLLRSHSSLIFEYIKLFHKTDFTIDQIMVDVFVTGIHSVDKNYLEINDE